MNPLFTLFLILITPNGVVKHVNIQDHMPRTACEEKGAEIITGTDLKYSCTPDGEDPTPFDDSTP